MKKKANDIDKLPFSTKEEFLRLENKNKIRRRGVGCGELVEPTPSFLKAPCEDVIEGKNNQFIVMGRDRSGPMLVTGAYDNGLNLGPYGPKGYTKAGMLDIVAGRFSSTPESTRMVGQQQRPVQVDPDFFRDASRIYVAQKTDVDYNFKIGSENNRESSGKAAIALKSDAIRIVAREGVKIVTGTDRFNSLGGKVHKVSGIDLIAGNDDRDMQSIPKGENLVEAVERLTNHVDKLNGILNAFLSYQMELNEAMMNHTHISPFYAVPTTPSETMMIKGSQTLMQMLNVLKPSIIANKINLANYKQNYLNLSGEKYICSRYNKTN